MDLDNLKPDGILKRKEQGAAAHKTNKLDLQNRHSSSGCVISVQKSKGNIT